MMSPRSALYLGVRPLPSETAGLDNMPTRVYFATPSTSEEAPATFDADNCGWEWCQSNADYPRTIELFNQLQDARVAGKTLLEFVWNDGVSMWQFLPSAYIFLAFFWAVGMIDTVSEIVDETKPQEIRVFPVDDETDMIWRGVVQAIGKARGVPVVVLPSRAGLSIRRLRRQLRRLLSQTAAGRSIIRLYHRLYRLACQPYRAVRGGVSSFSRLAPGGAERWNNEVASSAPIGKKALCATFGRRHWVGVPGDPSRKYDEQFYPLLPALRAAGWTSFVIIDCQDSPQSELEKRMHNGEAGVRWRRYASYRAWGGAARARALFTQMWQVLKDDPEFAKDFRYRGVSLMPALREELHRAFHCWLPECAQMLATAGRMLAEECPDAVIATDETGPWARALIIKAGRAGIPTMGLMHGTIFDDHYHYMHYRITTDPVAKPLGFVVPKITCVWGPIWKQILTKAGHYPPEAVVVTGNWRYDRLVEITGNADTTEFRRRFGIPPEKRVVLILSSSQDVIFYVRQCLQVLAGWPDCIPLIKLHPGDHPEPVRAMLRQLGYPAATLIKGQLADALMAADLVISQASTAVGEAVLLEKPVVLVDFDLTGFAEAYVEAGICLYVTTPAELVNAVEQGLNDAAVRSRLRTARTDFIPNYFFKLDGGASQRVAEALSKLSIQYSEKAAKESAGRQKACKDGNKREQESLIRIR